MGDKLYSFKEDFSKGFKRARKKAGYTQQKFVDEFKNVTIETVRNWEQGRNVPELETIYKICEFLNCDIDYLFARIDYKKHEFKYISEITGLSEKSIEMLEVLNNESQSMLPYGSYAMGPSANKRMIGAGKVIRVINELLENEYDRFVVNKKTGIMNNLFVAIDEYMHPLDFEFQVHDEKNSTSITGVYKPTIYDRSANTITFLNENEMYRNIVMSRITQMLNNLRYDMDF